MTRLSGLHHYNEIRAGRVYTRDRPRTKIGEVDSALSGESERVARDWAAGPHEPGRAHVDPLKAAAQYRREVRTAANIAVTNYENPAHGSELQHTSARFRAAPPVQNAIGKISSRCVGALQPPSRTARITSRFAHVAHASSTRASPLPASIQF